MMILFLIIILQLVIAGIVIFVLKNLLDKELKEAAIEKFTALKVADTIDSIKIYHTGQLSLGVKEQLIAEAKRKFENKDIVFEQNQILKGGMVIVAGEQVLDFSLANRLENFWS